MNIILSGCCGAMGSAICGLAQKSESGKDGVKIVAGIDKRQNASYPFKVFETPEQYAAESGANSDTNSGANNEYRQNLSQKSETGKPCAVIDFSHPGLFDSVLDFCVEKRLPLVCGTTGLSLAQHQKMSRSAQEIPIFYAENMSLGVYVFNKLAAAAAMLLSGFDIEIVEKHHKLKADSPSGTAMAVYKNLKGLIPDLKPITDRCGKGRRNAGEIGISSVRGGTIVGEHDVIFAGDNEVITICHSAQSKEIFAAGALRACRFLPAQKPGLYGMDSLANN